MHYVDLSLDSVGNPEDWSQGYKICSCFTQLSMKYIMLINVKMPTIVDILTFISIICTTFDISKAHGTFVLKHFSFYEHSGSVEVNFKKFYDIRAKFTRDDWYVSHYVFTYFHICIIYFSVWPSFPTPGGWEKFSVKWCTTYKMCLSSALS